MKGRIVLLLFPVAVGLAAMGGHRMRKLHAAENLPAAMDHADALELENVLLKLQRLQDEANRAAEPLLKAKEKLVTKYKIPIGTDGRLAVDLPSGDIIRDSAKPPTK